MIQDCVFQKKSHSKDNMIKTFNLQKILSNSRTDIFQTNEMRFCIDKKVVRIILYDKNNVALLEKLRNYFYGEEYERL